MFDLMRNSGLMGNPDAVPADSFGGGLEDLESALLESNMQEIDELQARNEQAGQGQENQMMMMLMQALGGGM
jgi:hypothetical protein